MAYIIMYLTMFFRTWCSALHTQPQISTIYQPSVTISSLMASLKSKNFPEVSSSASLFFYFYFFWPYIEAVHSILVWRIHIFVVNTSCGFQMLLMFWLWEQRMLQNLMIVAQYLSSGMLNEVFWLGFLDFDFSQLVIVFCFVYHIEKALWCSGTLKKKLWVVVIFHSYNLE